MKTQAGVLRRINEEEQKTAQFLRGYKSKNHEQSHAIFGKHSNKKKTYFINLFIYASNVHQTSIYFGMPMGYNANFDK